MPKFPFEAPKAANDNAAEETPASTQEPVGNTKVSQEDTPHAGSNHNEQQGVPPETTEHVASERDQRFLQDVATALKGEIQKAENRRTVRMETASSLPDRWQEAFRDEMQAFEDDHNQHMSLLQELLADIEGNVVTAEEIKPRVEGESGINQSLVQSGSVGKILKNAMLSVETRFKKANSAVTYSSDVLQKVHQRQREFSSKIANMPQDSQRYRDAAAKLETFTTEVGEFEEAARAFETAFENNDPAIESMDEKLMERVNNVLNLSDAIEEALSNAESDPEDSGYLNTELNKVEELYSDLRAKVKRLELKVMPETDKSAMDTKLRACRQGLDGYKELVGKVQDALAKKDPRTEEYITQAQEQERRNNELFADALGFINEQLRGQYSRIKKWEEDREAQKGILTSVRALSNELKGAGGIRTRVREITSTSFERLSENQREPLEELKSNLAQYGDELEALGVTLSHQLNPEGIKETQDKLELLKKKRDALLQQIDSVNKHIEAS